MTNNPTIVSASLSDKELQDSINKMVANFDKGLQTMLEHSNKYVEKIQASLQKIGDTNFGAKGSNGGEVVKQTKAQNDFTDAVKKSTDEIKRQGKEAAMSFDQMANAQQKAIQSQGDNTLKKSFNRQELQQYIDRLRELQAEYIKVNTQQGGGVKSDKIKADIRNLEELIAKYREILKNLDYVNSRQGTIDVKKWVQDLGAVDDRYKKLVRWYTVLEKEDQRRIASEEKANQKRLADLEKEKAAQDKVIKSYQDSVLKAEVGKVMRMPTTNIDEIRAKFERLSTIIANIRELGILSPEKISAADSEVKKLGASIQRYEKFEQERIAAEQKFIVEQAKEIEQTQTLEGRVKSLAQAIRERLKEEGRFVDMQAYGKDLRVYAENDARSKGLTIEQQIEKILQEENAARNARLSTEKQITQEVEKQKKEYVAPSSYKSLVVPSMLRPFVEEKLGLGFGGAITSDATSKIKTINAEIKQLNETWQKMSDWERKSPFGDTLRQRMQMLQRQSQQLNQQLSRPVNLKDALSGSEKTLDDIAYKMRRLASYRSGLNVKTQTKEIDQVNRKYTELQKKMNEVMAKNSQMTSSNNILANSWRYMRNRLAFYLTVSTGMTLVRDLARVRSEYEMNEKALGTLLNSAERGTRIFNELSNMALMSPYTLIELSAAAKQLTAYDIAAKDVVDTTRRLADISAAVGIPVERLTYALGQVKAYGHLTSQDARQFLNAGVPLVKELANRYSELEGRLVSTADVYDRMKKHAISYNDVLSVLTSMTDEGGHFFDYQAKMAETLKVRLANLSLAYNNMLNDMGKANGGTFTTGIKGLTQLLKHWREIERVLGTVVVGIGAYRTATLLAGITTQKVSGHSVAAWLRWANAIRTTQGNVALLSATMKAIPFAGWVTMIMSLVSYFVLFNNSTDETKQKLEDIATAFEGIRKEATDLFADAISTDNIGKQLTKLKDMLELAETELGITIPINLEDVNESNVKQKLRDAKNTIDNYVNFSQTFSEAAVDTRFNESMTDFGTTARSTYTSVTESINTVKVALQELVDAGKASKRDIEILKELDNKPKDGESRIEYFQRLVKLYEELGLLGQKKVEPMIEHNFFKAYFSSTWDNMEELEQEQEENLDRLGIKNKSVFENMLKDVQGYYSSSSIAAYQFEQQIERVAKSINLENIPISERTAKLEVAINQEAAKNNWNEFAIQYAKWVANQKFGLNITISEESKKDSEIELSDWQKRMQSWADKHGITFSLNFMEKEDEKTYADRMLQAAKDAQGKLDVLRRKLKVGTGSQTDVDNATKDYNSARLLALQAGADLSSLDKKSASSRKAASKAESELAKALKDELSTIDKVRSIYKDLVKDGASHANAVARATSGWNETVNAINRVLQKNGLQKLDLSKFAGIENPRELVNMLQSQLNTLLKRGAKPAEIKELQTKVNTLEVDADKYDLTKITKGLNSELDRLKEEYELAVAIDADPELGGIFADMFDLNIDQLPHTISEYAQKVTAELNKAIKDRGDNIQLPTIYLTKDDIDAFRKMSEDGKLNTKSFEDIQKAYQDFVSLRKKAATDVSKIASDYIREYGDLSAQIQQIEIEKNDALMKLNEIYNTDVIRQTQRYLDAKFAIEDGARRKQVKATFDALKKEADYERFFTAIDTLTKKDALSIKNKIKKGIIDAFKNGGLTISQFRKEIKALEEQFDKLSQPTSNWISYLNGGFDKLIQRAKETGQEIETIGEKISATGKVDEEDKNYLQSLGNIFSNGKGGNTDFSSLMSQFGKDMKGLGSNISKAGQGMQGASSNFASTVSIIDMIIKNIHQTVQGINSVMQELDSVRNEENKISNAYWEGFSKSDSYASSGWENLKSGNISGAIADTANSIISIFNTFENAKTDRINSEIKESERTVKNLENAYKNLEYASQKAFGTSISGAKQATKANKELQLAELRRQLVLENSRSSKNKDIDKINEIKGQIIDLEHEINDFTKNAVNELLGISSHGDFFENLISDMINAFKNGEDAMNTFEEKWSDMIDNMLMKTIVSQVLSQWINTLERGADEILNKYTEESAKKMADAESSMTNVRTMDAGDAARWIYENDKENFDKILESLGERNDVEQFFSKDAWFDQAWDSGLANKIKEAYFAMLNSNMTSLQDELDKQSLDATGELIDYYGEAGKEFKENYLGQILDKIQENWNFGQDSEKQLSNLQQGIQGITEDTAGALEAITNSISQQSYLQSDLLTQIRDAVVSMDMDVSLGVMSQILLQLQSSYQIQQSMLLTMENWTNPSGNAVRVELLS